MSFGSRDDELERIKAEKLKRLMRPVDPGPWVRGKVVELDESNFASSLRSTRLPVLVDFWADWCMPCKIMAPVLNELAAAYSDRAHFAKVNVDQNRNLSVRYGVMSIPNFVVFKGGRPVESVLGAVGRGALEATLKRHLNQ